MRRACRLASAKLVAFRRSHIDKIDHARNFVASITFSYSWSLAPSDCVGSTRRAHFLAVLPWAHWVSLPDRGFRERLGWNSADEFLIRQYALGGGRLREH